MANKKIVELLKKYIFLLKTEGISVEKAFLFGSYLSGNATNDSDIDLMIVTNDEDAENDLVAGKVWNLTRRISTKIEPFLIGFDKFSDGKSSPLVDLIKRKGIEIKQ